MVEVKDLEKVISVGTTDSPTATLVLAGAVLELSKAIRDSTAAALLPCDEDDLDLSPGGQHQAEVDEFVEPSARGTLPIEPIGPPSPIPTNAGRGCGCQHAPLPPSLGGPR